jgi:hypothetical protein
MGYIKPFVPGAEDRHHGSMVLFHIQDEVLRANV